MALIAAGASERTDHNVQGLGLAGAELCMFSEARRPRD